MYGEIEWDKKCEDYETVENKNKSIGKMNVYSFVSRWNRFELLIATFRLQYC